MFESGSTADQSPERIRWITTTRRKKKEAKSAAIKNTRIYVKTQIEKNHEAARKTTIFTEEKIENLTATLYSGTRSTSSHYLTSNPHDGAFSFIEITRVTCYEITKLPRLVLQVCWQRSF